LITATREAQTEQHDHGVVENPMPAPKYRLGQIVELKPAISRNVPGGTFEITKQLPENHGEYEYRIKSMNEPHERVRESELSEV
jgi:hypothetical protein